MLCMAVLIVTIPTTIARWFTHDVGVVGAAVPLLIVGAAFQFFDGVQVTATGALRGVGITKPGLAAQVMGYWVIGFPVGLWLGFAKKWGALDVFATQPPEVRALAHADRLRNDPRALAAALRALGSGAMEPMWDRLGELALPVTLVAGDRDPKYVDLARRMAERIAGAEVVVVPGAGHAVHLEDPDAVAALLIP